MTKRFIRSEKLYYRLIVAACMLVMGATIALTSNCSSLFIVPISEGLNLPRSGVGLISTVLFLSYSASSMFAGFFYRRFDTMRLFLAAGAVMSAAFACYALCSQLWQFYVLSAVIGLAEPYASMLPVAKIVGNWFYERTGTAMGIATMGTGVSGMLMGVLTGQWIAHLGWRAAYGIQAAVMAAVLLSTGVFILREKPADVGCRPYGSRAAQPVLDTAGRSFREYRFSAVFIALCAAMLLNTTGSQMLVSALEPHLENVGYAATKAALYLSLAMGALAAGKVFLGMLLDKIGLRRTTWLALGVMALTHTAVLLAQLPVMIPLIIAGMGFACAYITVGMPLMVRRVFGPREYTSFYGMGNAIANIGGAVIPVVSGAVFDATGSYRPLFLAGYATVAAAALLYGYVMRREHIGLRDPAAAASE